MHSSGLPKERFNLIFFPFLYMIVVLSIYFHLCIFYSYEIIIKKVKSWFFSRYWGFYVTQCLFSLPLSIDSLNEIMLYKLLIQGKVLFCRIPIVVGLQ